VVTESIEGGLKHAKYPKLFPWSISNTSQLLVSVVRRVFPSIATSSITSLSSILSLVHSLMIITQITMSFCRQGPGRNAAKEKTESFLSKVIFEVSKIASFESKIEEPFGNRRTILYDLYHIPKTRADCATYMDEARPIKQNSRLVKQKRAGHLEGAKWLSHSCRRSNQIDRTNIYGMGKTRKTNIFILQEKMRRSRLVKQKRAEPRRRRYFENETVKTHKTKAGRPLHA